MDNLRFHVYVSQIPAESSRAESIPMKFRDEVVHFVKFSAGPPLRGERLIYLDDVSPTFKETASPVSRSSHRPRRSQEKRAGDRV